MGGLAPWLKLLLLQVQSLACTARVCKVRRFRKPNTASSQEAAPKPEARGLEPNQTTQPLLYILALAWVSGRLTVGLGCLVLVS